MKWLCLLALTACSQVAPPPNVAPAYDSVYALDLGDRHCSAVALGPDTFVTAAHCADKPGLLVGPDGSLYPAEQRASSPVADIALGRSEALPSKARVAQELPRLGEPVLISGKGCLLPVRPGLWVGGQSWVVSGQVCPGDSGGGIFNKSGELVAIISMYQPDPPLGFVVPVGEAASLFGP